VSPSPVYPRGKGHLCAAIEARIQTPSRAGTNDSIDYI
jgi:hypothetical protein